MLVKANKLWFFVLDLTSQQGYHLVTVSKLSGGNDVKKSTSHFWPFFQMSCVLLCWILLPHLLKYFKMSSETKSWPCQSNVWPRTQFCWQLLHPVSGITCQLILDVIWVFLNQGHFKCPGLW